MLQEVEVRSLVVQVEVEEASSAQRVEYRQDPSAAHQQRADVVYQRETEDSEQQVDALQHRDRQTRTCKKTETEKAKFNSHLI